MITTEVASQTDRAGEQRDDGRVGAEINNGLETKLRLRAARWVWISEDCLLDTERILLADFT